MKIEKYLFLSLIGILLLPVVSAGAHAADQQSYDPVINACHDEIARSVKDLHVERFPAPYFIINR